MLGLLTRNKVYLKNVDTFVGSSVGAIIGVLLSIGMTPEDMFLYIISKYTKLTLLVNVQMMLIDLFTDRGFASTITFKELFDVTQKRCIVSAYHMKEKRAMFYDHVHHPNKLVVDALKETSNLNPASDELFFDGALCSPFPVRYCKQQALGSIFGVCTYASDKNYPDTDECDTFPGRLYNKLKIIQRRTLTMLFELEIGYADSSDRIIHIDHYIPLEMLQMNGDQMISMFFEGMKSPRCSN